MHLQWYGQSAFRLTGGDARVVIDPFGDMSAATARGMQWDYPAITGASADLLMVTHEHSDHNGVEAVEGEPVVIRSTAGTHESPIGEVISIASEHDEVAGTQRGANTMLVFSYDGLRVAHLGDLGQPTLRPEQSAALGKVDVLIVPVGGGPTIGPDEAYEIVKATEARWVVPMHYRTEKIGFLDTADAFIAKFDQVHRCDTPAFETGDVAEGLVIPAAP